MVLAALQSISNQTLQHQIELQKIEVEEAEYKMAEIEEGMDEGDRDMQVGTMQELIYIFTLMPTSNHSNHSSTNAPQTTP